MDPLDIALGIGLVVLVALVFGLLLPPYGYLFGALIGAFLTWRAVKRRRQLLDRNKTEQK